MKIKKQDLINKIVDELFEQGLTIEDIDISKYENAIIKAIEGN